MIPPEVLAEAFEGLINFVASEQPGPDERSKALRGLIQLRDCLLVEVELPSITNPEEWKD